MGRPSKRSIAAKKRWEKKKAEYSYTANKQYESIFNQDIGKVGTTINIKLPNTNSTMRSLEIAINDLIARIDNQTQRIKEMM